MAAAFRILPFLGFFTFLVQLAIPFFYTTVALFPNRRTHSDHLEAQRVQWLMYWIIYCLYSWIENFILFPVAKWIPLYGEVKLLWFMWLSLPDFQGATWLWCSILELPFRNIDEVVLDFLNSRMQSVLAFCLGGGAGPVPSRSTTSTSQLTTTNKLGHAENSGPALAGSSGVPKKDRFVESRQSTTANTIDSVVEPSFQ